MSCEVPGRNSLGCAEQHGLHRRSVCNQTCFVSRRPKIDRFVGSPPRSSNEKTTPRHRECRAVVGIAPTRACVRRRLGATSAARTAIPQDQGDDDEATSAADRDSKKKNDQNIKIGGPLFGAPKEQISVEHGRVPYFRGPYIFDQHLLLLGPKKWAEKKQKKDDFRMEKTPSDR